MRGAGVIGLFVLAMVVIAASAPAVVMSAPATDGSRPRSVVLGSGEIAGDPWSASVVREHGASRSRRVADLQSCIGIDSERLGGGQGGEACTFGSRLTPDGGALWITTSEPNLAETETAMTAVAMVFAPVSASVKATLVDGTVETIGLRRLTADQARTAGLGRLRYAAFATAGTWCVARLESFDRAGHRLWRGTGLRKRSCPAGG